MKICLLGIFFLLSFERVHAQSISLASYYPASAFVTNRLLPFTVTGGANLFIKSVQLKSGDGCQGFVDPYHARVFHIYCLRPSLVTAEITVSDSSLKNYSLSLNFINVFSESLPNQLVTPSFKVKEGG